MVGWCLLSCSQREKTEPCQDAGAQLQVSTSKDGKERGMKSEVSVGARKAVGSMVGDVVNVCVLWG